ncbi:unknown [Clostridium sp. CAG:510]|nr:unknown [Clostridium sp. CAG:510]
MDVTGMLPVERQYWGKISINREHIRRKHLVKKSLVHGFLF